ncbi:MAG: SDR family oxidoreductase [Chloroflexota bacterium]|nr:SDR family oxidoreductase [Chloroflexota bacterium]
MNLGLTNRAAIVLAASDGLGKAIARALVREGVDVAVCSRHEDRIQAAAAEIKAQGPGRVLAHACDVSNAGLLTGFIETAIRELGRLDILVTNTGGPPGGSFSSLDDRTWDAAFEQVLMSVVRSIRAALPALRQSDQARIISIVSSSVRQPIPNLVLSNTFRPALNGLIKTLATELAGDGILVNAIAPGRIDTARVRSLDQSRAESRGIDVERAREEAMDAIPLGRYGTPDEFAEVAVFLASAAARYMTGSTLLVDGGLVRALP